MIRLSESDDKLMKELYDDGFSSIMIGRLFEVDKKTALRHLKNAGTVMRKGNEAVGRGPNHVAWKGGRVSSGENSAYVSIWVSDNDPMSSMRDHSGYVREHRLIIARNIGRPLTRQETVHHIDGNTHNNEISNLQLRRSHHGPGQAHVCGDCGSINILSVEL